MSGALQDRPLVRLQLVLADGRYMQQDWSLADMDAGRFKPEMLEEIVEDWMLDLRKEWPHPQDPVTHVADVQEGFEEEAARLMQRLAATQPKGERDAG